MRKLFLLNLLLCAVVYVQAQPLPQDEKLRTGTLSNGLTYYIRYNKLPEQRADFYIAQKVGSILEEENQRGLAHFLEHMAFNGTKNFPNNSLRDYLEKNGVKFGENLNAYTWYDETVYNIKNVPTRQGLMDSCLLILHDWSSFITLDNAEIDKERGVIHEEWRTRNNAWTRMYEKLLPEVYGNDRYGHRFTIGLMEVVDNFKYQELRDYYHKWYRPDLQGIVVVGDFDVDAMEEKIKTIFADIPTPKNPAERVYYPVSDNREPVIAIATDAEATSSHIWIFNKREAFPEEMKNNYQYFVLKRYIKDLAMSMINTRLGDIAQQKADVPYSSASTYDEMFFWSKTKDAYTAYAQAKEGQIEQTLRLLVQELERMKRYGFTQTEFDRARANFLKGQEVAYNERDKEKNDKYINEYVRLFLDKEPVPGIEFQYRFFNDIAEKLPVDVVNNYAKQIVGDTNVVIMLMMPQKEDLRVPTKEELLTVYNQAKTDSVSPYVDKVIDTKLIKKLPKAGKVKSKKDYALGSVEWTLSNGHRVIFKQTDFKQDQILMKAVSKGGNSLLDEKDMPTIYLLSDIINESGVGDFRKMDLLKALAGKNVIVNPSVGLYTEELNGHCSPSDFETMLQWIYLYMTNLNFDREAYDAYISRKRNELQNAELSPYSTLNDTITGMIYGNHPRGKRIKLAMIDEVNYDLAHKMYRERYANGDQFTFTFVGNINPDNVQKLIEKYLGALPKTKEKETFRDVKLYPAKGEKSNIFDRQMETSKTSVFIYYSGNCDYTLKNKILMDMLRLSFNIVYTEKVREDEGGTYGVYVSGELNKHPYPNFDLQILFETNPDIVQKLMQIIYNEIDSTIANSVREADFLKVKEFMQKKIKENKAENGYWLAALEELGMTATDLASDYESTLNAITMEDVKNFAAEIFNQKNRVEVIMNPK